MEKRIRGSEGLELIQAAAPALQDLTITDVVGWFSGEDWQFLSTALHAELLENDRLTGHYVRLGLELCASSPLIRNDPQSLAVCLVRLALINLFTRRAATRFADTETLSS